MFAFFSQRPFGWRFFDHHGFRGDRFRFFPGSQEHGNALGHFDTIQNPKVCFFPGKEFFQATRWATMFKRRMGGFIFDWSGRERRYSRAATACAVAATATHMAFNRISFNQDLLVLVDLALEVTCSPLIKNLRCHVII
ncbi:hypothetical protein [Pantoea sp. SM3640]|uniref:hypothetical protein n=1 Tax=Pantoea sp. SM3640 TaxID=2787629 RepID=UPI001E5E4943|nr:hypothetical protein [Pantoea sp. SM3640]